MARAKLSSDTQALIVTLYRESEITASALAARFSVSNSTISRVLREAIPAAEYRRLSRQKRSSDTPLPELADTAAAEASEPALDAEMLLDIAEAPEQPILESSEPDVSVEPDTTPEPVVLKVIAPEKPIKREDILAKKASVELAQEQAVAANESEPDDDDDTDDSAADEISDDFAAEPLDLDYALDDDTEDEEDDDSDSDEADADLDQDADDDEPVSVDIQSLTSFEYPEEGFALIDKYQELVTSPLSAFISQVPPELANAVTLPVFDTHRGARRYSHQVRGKQHKYRVLPFPGEYLEKTRSHLQAKGITHLILNHQVFAL